MLDLSGWREREDLPATEKQISYIYRMINVLRCRTGHPSMADEITRELAGFPWTRKVADSVIKRLLEETALVQDLRGSDAGRELLKQSSYPDKWISFIREAKSCLRST